MQSLPILIALALFASATQETDPARKAPKKPPKKPVDMEASF